MTRRRELVLRIVLNEISDDYENLHEITKQVRRTSVCGMTISVHEILQALADLVAAGVSESVSLVKWSQRNRWNASRWRNWVAR